MCGKEVKNVDSNMLQKSITDTEKAIIDAIFVAVKEEPLRPEKVAALSDALEALTDSRNATINQVF
mgnify:CR=1 FL=1